MVTGMVLISCLAVPARADRYVSPSGSNTEPYNSWATAANSIQDAIDAADPGETVWVDSATYLLGSEILVDKAVRLQGDGGAAILDGQDATRCLRVTDSGAQIEAFNITGGRAVEGGGVYLEAGTLSDCSVIGNLGYSSGSTGMIVRGGGVYVGGSGVVTNCTISENLATGNWHVYGGGACLMPGAVVVDSDIISNTITSRYYEVRGAGLHLEGGGEVFDCSISNNVGISSYYYNSFGGGVHISNDGIVENCDIVNNQAYYGGGAYLYSGGEVTDCTINYNTAGNLGGGAMLYLGGTISESDVVGNGAEHGGGLRFTDGGIGRHLLVENNHAQSGGGASVVRATLTDSIIRNNEATTQFGGGLTLSGSSAGPFALLRNCLVEGNAALEDYSDGGGIYSSSAIIENCTVTANSNVSGGGGIYMNGVSTLRNSIVYGNTSLGTPNVEGSGNNITYEHTCTDVLLPGTGNVAADPYFADPETGNFHLLPGSLCRNVGVNQEWMASADDLDGNARVLGGTVDMGCYEIEFSALTCNPVADFTEGAPPLVVNFNAFVAGANTTALTYQWDINDDGTWDYSGAGLDAVSHTYTEVGLYSVTLRVTNGGGEEALTTRRDYIRVLPMTTYVSPSGSHTYPYADWASAATNFSAAIESVLPGGEVLVADGTYPLSSEILIDRQVTLRGANGTSSVILDGQDQTLLVQLSAEGCVLADMTLRRGDGGDGGAVYMTSFGMVTNCVFADNYASYGGAGIYCRSTGKVIGCTFSNNVSDSYGGALYFDGAGSVIDCTIISNYCDGDGGAIYFDDPGNYVGGCSILSNEAYSVGGGIYCYYGGTTIENCEISCNTAGEDGGGIYSYDTGVIIESCVVNSNRAEDYPGGGIYLYEESVVRNTEVRGNYSAEYGGGIYCYYGDNIIENCTIADNTAMEYGGGIYLYDSYMTNCIITGNVMASSSYEGGGVYLDGGEMVNCLVADNVSSNTGGGVYLYSGLLQNCTVAGNMATVEGGGIYEDGGEAFNTIIYHNTAPTGPDRIGGGTAYSYCTTLPLASGTGNITNNPQFVSLAAHNFHLQPGSPCIDTGTANNAPPFDLEGTTRPLDGNESGTAEFDMGCYEYETIPVDRDTDMDGLTDLDEINIYDTDPENPDSDNDGTWDGDEVIAGTDPNLQSDVFRIVELDREPAEGQLVITWLSKSNRTYTVKSCSVLDDPWDTIPGQVDLPGTGEMMSFTSTVPAEVEFYVIEVALP